MRENRIKNPFTQGQTVTLPAGTVVDRPTQPRKPGEPRTRTLRRALTVTLRQVSDGWVDLDYGTTPGTVFHPRITWAGAGGYWAHVRVTPELCDALGVPHPDIPQTEPDPAN